MGVSTRAVYVQYQYALCSVSAVWDYFNKNVSSRRCAHPGIATNGRNASPHESGYYGFLLGVNTSGVFFKVCERFVIAKLCRSAGLLEANDVRHFVRIVGPKKLFKVSAFPPKSSTVPLPDEKPTGRSGFL